MKRRWATSICAALLVWATLDDVVAALTPEPEDDLAAALDNDCIQCAGEQAPARAEAAPSLAGNTRDALSPTVAIAPWVKDDFPVSDPLYLFMSLQR